MESCFSVVGCGCILDWRLRRAKSEIDTYHHANDWDQEDDLNQAVEDEEDASNHLDRV
jgi:hypothetical protein